MTGQEFICIEEKYDYVLKILCHLHFLYAFYRIVFLLSLHRDIDISVHQGFVFFYPSSNVCCQCYMIVAVLAD